MADAGGAGFVLWQVSNLWQRNMRRALSPFGLTHVQFGLLAGLAAMERDCGGVVTQVDLAAFCHVDPMMTSQVLRTLEAAGYVARAPHPTDTRAKCPTLTASGAAILARAAPEVALSERAFFAMAGKKSERLVRSLRKLRRRAEAAMNRQVQEENGK
ncbi:putative HTH-type transcriptional regulator YdcH [Allostella humosa]|uniref:MarR family winged helix-turn-helix transcriptional regulator n=1 Tax=Stella humosa TaxID=94 RepID=UPI001139115A|nr:MarR family transcriptional regulator [Stella humosa]BBK29775.1 putative HTH-type transcriptional regulator YdcH [Stella humosa]